MRIAVSRIQWTQREARPNQLPPESNWITWLILSGRGWGKTRVGAEWIVWNAINNPKTRWAVIARTSADIRDTCFEGVSGIIVILQRYGIYDEKAYNRTNSSYKLPNGSIIKGFSAEEPKRLRGPQHHGAWCDELAAWENHETWDQLKLGLRLKLDSGQPPQIVVTTTPTPIKLITELMKQESTVITRGSTFDNKNNLSPEALAELEFKYAGTRLGQQELYGAILSDNPGALWTRELLDKTRVQVKPENFTRIVVGVDPAVTSGENSDNTGIVVAGSTADGQYYVLEDATMKASPQVWASKAVALYHKWQADKIIAEVNNGGDLVVELLRQVNQNIPVKKVTATRGKQLRAEPIAALFEQGRVHLVGSFLGVEVRPGVFDTGLEDQLCDWTPESKESPDRMDAMVWALTELSTSSGFHSHMEYLKQKHQKNKNTI
jgi:phage terminase large subunit-like protein